MSYSTPWGTSDLQKQLIKDVAYYVSTPRHGGIMLDKQWARENLSDHAIAQSIHQGRWIFFEEDQDYAIACYESEAIRTAMDADKDETEGIVKTIIPYCLAAGIVPDQKALAFWKRLHYHPRYRHNIDLRAIAQQLEKILPEHDPWEYYDPSLDGKEYDVNAHYKTHYTGVVTLDNDNRKLWAEVIEVRQDGSEWPFQVSL